MNQRYNIAKLSIFFPTTNVLPLVLVIVLSEYTHCWLSISSVYLQHTCILQCIPFDGSPLFHSLRKWKTKIQSFNHHVIFLKFKIFIIALRLCANAKCEKPCYNRFLFLQPSLWFCPSLFLSRNIGRKGRGTLVCVCRRWVTERVEDQSWNI